MITRAICVALALLIGVASGCVPKSPAAPAISISTVPVASIGGPNRMARIAGRVTGAMPGQKIVLYARSGPWFVQPYRSLPYTDIHVDGGWEAQTHLGTEYAALLVDAGYRPPTSTGDLPAIGNGVVAVVRLPGG